MEKTIRKIVLSLLCMGLVSSVFAAVKTVSEATARSKWSDPSVTRYVSNHGWSSKGLWLYDAYAPNEDLQRAYSIYIYGKIGNGSSCVDAYVSSLSETCFFDIDDYENNRYGYIGKISNSNVSTNITNYTNSKYQTGKNVVIPTKDVNGMIGDVKDAGYRNARFVLHDYRYRPSTSDESSNEVHLFDYYIFWDYRLPADGTLDIREEWVNGQVYKSHDSMAVVSATMTSSRSLLLKWNIHYGDSLYRRDVQRFVYYYVVDQNGNVRRDSTGWENVDSAFDVTYHDDGDRLWNNFFVSVREDLPTEALAYYRMRMITHRYDIDGIPVYDTTYSNIDTVAHYTFVELGVNSGSGRFELNGESSDDVFVTHGGGEHQLSAIPATGYSFKNWVSGGKVISTDNPLPLNAIMDTSIQANFIITPLESRLWVASIRHNSSSLTTNSDTSNATFDFNYGQDSLVLSRYVKGTNLQSRTMLEYSVDGGSYKTLESYQTVNAANTAAGFLLANSIKINRSGEALFGGSNKGSIRGNEYTVIRMKVVYSDSTDRPKYSKVIRINWKYSESRPLARANLYMSQIKRGSYSNSYDSMKVVSTDMIYSQDTVMLRWNIHYNDTLYKYSLQRSHYYYKDNKGNPILSGWDELFSYSKLTSHDDGDRFWATYRLYKNHGLDPNETIAFYRICMITHHRAATGSLLFDTTYSNVDTVRFNKLIELAVNEGKGTLEEDGKNVEGAYASIPGRGWKVDAIPAAGYSFKNWVSGGKVISTDNPLSFGAIMDTSIQANFIITPLESRLWVASSKYNGGSLLTNGDTSATSFDFVRGRDTLVLSRYFKGTNLQSRRMLEYSIDGGSYQTLESYQTIDAATTAAGSLLANNIRISRYGEAIVEGANKGPIRGNKYTDIRMKVIYSDSADRPKYSKVIRINWKYSVMFYAVDGKLAPVNDAYGYNESVAIPTDKKSFGIPESDSTMTVGYHWVNLLDSTETIPSTQDSLKVGKDSLKYKAVVDYEYVVKFYDKDSVQIGKKQLVERNGSATAPDAPEFDGYVFKEWSVDFTHVRSYLEVYSVYLPIPLVDIAFNDAVAGMQEVDVSVPECFSVKKSKVYDSKGEKLVEGAMKSASAYVWKAKVSVDTGRTACAKNELVKSILAIIELSDSDIPAYVNGKVANENIASSLDAFDVEYAFTAKAVPASSSSAKAKSSSSKAKSSSSSAKAKSSSSKKKTALPIMAQVPQFSLFVNGRTMQIAGARVGSKMDVFDLQGHKVLSGSVDVANFSVAMPRPGSYLVRIDGQTQNVNIK